jgi:rod shape-determining protein MreD
MPRVLRAALALALVIAGAVLVVTLRARGWSVLPDLALLPVVALALSRGWLAGALLGLAAGWVVDLVPPGGDPLGLTPILYALAGSLAGRASRVGPVPVRWVAIVTCGAAAVPAAGRLLQGAWLGRQLDVVPTLTGLLASVVVGALIVPPLLRLDRGEEPAW